MHYSFSGDFIVPGRRKTGVASQGVTRVLECCEFPWIEMGGRRVATVPSGAHQHCIAELERGARANGVVLDLDADSLMESSVVYPLVVTVTLKG